jgi:hypothetical protein
MMVKVTFLTLGGECGTDNSEICVFKELRKRASVMNEFSFVRFTYVIIINTGFGFNFRIGQGWKRLAYFCHMHVRPFGMEEVVLI